jgi:hypothetical protein
MRMVGGGMLGQRQRGLALKTPFVKDPVVAVPNAAGECVAGWAAITHRLRRAIAERNKPNPVVTVECYIGVDEQEVLSELTTRLAPALVVHARDALWPPSTIETMVAPFLGGDDPVFGFLSPLTLPEFFDPAALARLREQVTRVRSGMVLVVGCGARLVAQGDLLVYADLARWEAQNRFRRNESSNLGVDNRTLTASLQYKRAFFVDWRVCDRWKQPLIGQWDFVLDTNQRAEPKLAEGEAVRRGLRETVRRPFQVVPFFDPAPWGGQWMMQQFGLDPNVPNYGWGFNCVPEENSLLLGMGDLRLEIPALNLVLDQPRDLLGDAVYARFGAEFPIRFDFLDTIGGGNLSFQVHPTAEYMRERFGLSYTQDESYYILEADPGASVYLGLKTGIDPTAMLRDLRAAQNNGRPFDPDRFANRWPARKHDHFLIPAGTVHCSGVNAMVLEISATPYIFTFKLWDWGRLGLDGQPRPVSLDHGERSIAWNRDTAWTRRQLINRVEPVGAGPGWHEERTGLHELQFIETRRHWFTDAVPHHTRDGVNVLTLDAFAPFLVHYAETFIVPAAVGHYVIRPATPQPGRTFATIKASVRS